MVDSHNHTDRSHQSHHQRFLEQTHHHRHVRYHVPQNLDQDRTVKTFRLIGYTLSTILVAVFIGYIAYTFVYLSEQKPREELEQHLSNRRLLLAGENPADSFNQAKKQADAEIVSSDSNQDKTNMAPINATSWKTYKNTEMKFEIRHPTEMGVIEGLSNPAIGPGEHILLHNPISGDKVNIHVQRNYDRPVTTSTLYEYQEFQVQGYDAIRLLMNGPSQSTKYEVHIKKDSEIWNISGSVIDDENKVENLARVALIIDSFSFLD